jgi:hypothetical protein
MRTRRVAGFVIVLSLLAACGATGEQELPKSAHSGDIEAPPLDRRGATTLVWTGEELVVFGGTRDARGRVQFLRDGAMFRPADDAWYGIDDMPIDPAPASPAAVWTGRHVVVLSRPCDVQHEDSGEWSCPDARHEAAALDPKSGEWTAIEVPEGVGVDLGESVPTAVGSVDGRAIFNVVQEEITGRRALWAWDGEEWEQLPVPRFSQPLYCDTADGVVAAAEIVPPSAAVLRLESEVWKWSQPKVSPTRQPAPFAVRVGCAPGGLLAVPADRAPAEGATRFDEKAQIWGAASEPPGGARGYPLVFSGGDYAAVPGYGAAYDWRRDRWIEFPVDDVDRVGNAIAIDGGLVIERVGRGQSLSFEFVPLP